MTSQSRANVTTAIATLVQAAKTYFRRHRLGSVSPCSVTATFLLRSIGIAALRACRVTRQFVHPLDCAVQPPAQQNDQNRGGTAEQQWIIQKFRPFEWRGSAAIRALRPELSS